ncbi:MAG: DUF393 domain-containing protein [Oceanicaulis sp.]
MDGQTQKTTESPAPEPGAADTAAGREGACAVYFDGACPLCRAEIGLYRRSGAEAEFVDLTENGPPAEISREQALGRFHVRKPDGTLVSGAAAFAELWKATPGWRTLGRVAALPPFVWIGEGLYRVFLIVRPQIQAVARRLSG